MGSDGQHKCRDRAACAWIPAVYERGVGWVVSGLPADFEMRLRRWVSRATGMFAPPVSPPVPDGLGVAEVEGAWHAEERDGGSLPEESRSRVRPHSREEAPRLRGVKTN